jgi:hypothetical protein
MATPSAEDLPRALTPVRRADLEGPLWVDLPIRRAVGQGPVFAHFGLRPQPP